MAENQGQQMRFTDDEIRLIKGAFGGNDTLLKLLRKVFLPEYDPKAPISQVIDLWMTVSVKNLSPEEARINIIARNEVINHIEQQLIQLKILSEQKLETFEEVEKRLKKDSNK